jgi:plasmid stabilization system protein ParE
MSVRKLILRLTPQARQDFDDVLLYTEATWGQDQADHYESLIIRTLETLLDNPTLVVNDVISDPK